MRLKPFALRAPMLAQVALELSKPPSAPHRVAAMAMARAEADMFTDIMVIMAADTRPKLDGYLITYIKLISLGFPY